MHEVFISVVSLFNYLMKILVGLVIFDRVTFKDFGSDCYCKNSIFQLAEEYLFV